MESIALAIHVLLAVGLVVLILMQQGKGADMGAAFGAGASATVFGSRGAGNFITRTTAVLATLFFVTSLVLAYLASQRATPTAVEAFEETAVTQDKAPTMPEVPAQPSEEPGAVPIAPPVE